MSCCSTFRRRTPKGLEGAEALCAPLLQTFLSRAWQDFADNGLAVAAVKAGALGLPDQRVR